MAHRKNVSDKEQGDIERAADHSAIRFPWFDGKTEQTGVTKAIGAYDLQAQGNTGGTTTGLKVQFANNQLTLSAYNDNPSRFDDPGKIPPPSPIPPPPPPPPGPSPLDYVITARRDDIGRAWKCVAISDDGQKLIASDNQVHGSMDGGVSWFTNVFYIFRDVEMTSTGSIVLAGRDSNDLVIAYNWGNPVTAWNPKDSGRNWYGVALSEDGTKMVACVYSGQLYVSTDSGNTWTPKDSSRAWSGVACSDDGTKMFAVDNLFGKIYVSTDTGNTWTPKGSNAPWTKICCSADGTIVYAAKTSGGIEVSTDSGNTWTPTSASSLYYADISCSANGSVVMAVVGGGGGQAYMSTDSGLNWMGIGSSLVWRSVNCSADGKKLAACADGNYIYTFVSP
jgi:photosystem II stability/assembly factor-like uncharacterized protein